MSGLRKCFIRSGNCGFLLHNGISSRRSYAAGWCRLRRKMSFIFGFLRVSKIGFRFFNLWFKRNCWCNARHHDVRSRTRAGMFCYPQNPIGRQGIECRQLMESAVTHKNCWCNFNNHVKLWQVTENKPRAGENNREHLSCVPFCIGLVLARREWTYQWTTFLDRTQV